MSIQDDRNDELRQSLDHAIGEPQAERLMTLLPDRPMSELASRDDVEELQTDVTDLKADVTELKADVTELKADVTDLKADVTDLRGDVAELKGDFRELRDEFGDLKVQFAELKAEVAAQVLNHTLALGSLMIVILLTILGVGLTGGFA